MNVAICIIMLLLRFEGVHESKVKRSGKHSTMYGANTENHENSWN